MNESLYVYPIDLPGNEYLENNKMIWNSMNYEVKNWKDVFTKITKPSQWGKDILVLNFFENMPLYKPKCIKLLVALLILVIAKFVVRKIVWVRHNFKPHEATGNVYYKILLRALDKLSDVRVAHRPVTQIKIDRVVQHPLYNQKIHFSKVGDTDAEIKFIYFGIIKEYKGIPELVSTWPEDIKLSLYGKCSDDGIINEIRSVIENKKNISWCNEFIERGELDRLITTTDYVVIPHVDNSMIVSGAIFHAMSLGANLLIKDSDFAKWCVAEYPFVKTYTLGNLKEIVKDLKKTNHVELISYINEKNSPVKIKKEWSEIFNG